MQFRKGSSRVRSPHGPIAKMRFCRNDRTLQQENPVYNSTKINDRSDVLGNFVNYLLKIKNIKEILMRAICTIIWHRYALERENRKRERLFFKNRFIFLLEKYAACYIYRHL